jgi:hypothetical protein
MNSGCKSFAINRFGNFDYNPLPFRRKTGTYGITALLLTGVRNPVGKMM